MASPGNTDVTAAMVGAFSYFFAFFFFIALALVLLIGADAWWRHFPNGPPLHLGLTGGAVASFIVAFIALNMGHKQISSIVD